MCEGTGEMQLLERANPWLFSEETYEEYPLEYEELKHYLANDVNTCFPHRKSRPYTHIDYLDFLLYKRDGSGSGIDLEKKLLCEYALYQVQSHQKQSKLRDVSSVTLKQLTEMESQSAEWYEYLLVLLESINATKVDAPLFNIGKMSSDRKPNVRGLQRSNTIIRTNGALQELTSFVLSSAIKKGIELKPVNMDNPIEFLKDAIESLTSHSQENSEPLEETVDDIHKQKEELETAFKDLQLAHSFLTKQFENDRTEYLQNTEKIQNTNKELQQKILDYHADLSKSESQLGKAQLEVKELKAATKRDSEKIRSLDMSSPVPSLDFRYPESPTLSLNNTNGHSISIMRTEFRRMYAESQRKYEREIQEEREARLLLEKELAAIKKNGGLA